MIEGIMSKFGEPPLSPIYCGC